MNRTLMLTVTCLIAATAAAQSKTQTTPKIPQNGFFPAPGGAQTLLVGGSDDCSTAATTDVVTAAMSPISITNVGATNGAPDAVGCVDTQLDVWFYYTASITGRATVAACGGVTADTVLTVWADGSPAGTCPTTSIACNDDFCSLQSSATFCVVAGQSYFLQWGAFGAATTYTGTFTITEVPIVEVGNDSCATPTALPNGSTTFAFDNTAATTGCQGQSEALCLAFATTVLSKDTWYTWQPTVTGTVTVSTCGLLTGTSTLDSRIAVYDGAGCPTGAALACNDDAVPTCSGQTLASTLTFNAVCGHTYTIQLGQFSTSATANLMGSCSVTEDPLGTPCSPSVEKCGNGDALRIPCPCANNGTDPHAGCANSLNPAGASLSTSGSVLADNVVLNATGMTGAVAIFIREDGRTPGGVVFGDGVKCGGGSLLRLRAVAFGGTIASVASFPVPPETITLSARSGTFVGSGVAMQYGAYYRNAAAAFCPPLTFNVTDTEEIVW